MRLWYTKPAGKWTQALPVGNGRLGAMVFGRVGEEKISLNEDTLWSGYPRELVLINKSEYFVQAAELAKNGKYHEAQRVVESELTSKWTQAYMPVGDIIISMEHKGEAKDYERGLDIHDAVSYVKYTVDGVNYRRETISSAPDNVIAINISGDKEKSVSFGITFESLLPSEVSAKGDTLQLKGQTPSHVEPSYSNDLEEPVQYYEDDAERGMLFAAMAKVKTQGGSVSASGMEIKVSNADSATIYIDIRTSFSDYNTHPFLNPAEYEKPCLENVKKVSEKPFVNILQSHIEDYTRYYDRVSLDLGESEASMLPTDERLYRFLENHDDPSLYTLLFQYGRYLLISSSRPGTQPANLQGIWNADVRPPWSSNYTININTQMNYWPAFTCGLAEMQQPLEQLIEDISVTGRQTAREIYGARGFAAHHNTDIWKITWPMGNKWKDSACFAFWNMSAGWLCRHLFDRYEYTLDKAFLEEKAYPIMKSAAEFLLDILIEDKDGYLILCPSTSPENTFMYEGEKCNVAATATMSMAIARELFSNCIKSCNILGTDADFAKQLEETIERLYPFQTGSRGELLEWYGQYEEFEPTHRHISHLYGLHPSNILNIEDTPELAAACKRSLELRGDDGTGWSLGWKINQWARLFDGNHALKLLNMQLRVVEETENKYSEEGGTFINMFDAHPPFQIDGNFGAAAGIAEMLLQSRDDKIFVLPALPDAWKRGGVKGLCAKGGVRVDISWDENKVEAVLVSDIDQTIRVAFRGLKHSDVILKKNEAKAIVL